MIEDEFGHFKHADALFAIEYLAQFIVRLDEGFVLRVLKVVAADVIPEFLGDFSAGERLSADDFAEFLVGLNWLQKSGARLSFSFGLCFGHK